jgi:uncharacterized oxidoreductase
MTVLDTEDVASVVAAIFRAIGADEKAASLVSRELTGANQMGLASHGLIRVRQYVSDVEAGRIRPGAPMSIVHDAPACAVVDCGRDFGQVSAYALLAIAADKASAMGLAAVVGRECNHVGRLGAYAEAAARNGYVCIAAVGIPPRGHFIVPWGGRDGRLGTNPIAYGVPTTGDPLVSDFSTSVLSEGKVRLARARGAQVPEDAILDAEGHSTRDPDRFYGPPMGRMLPFGGTVGYKGYALGLLAEFLGASLAGIEVDDERRPDNGPFLLLIDPARFLPEGVFAERTSELGAYVRSSAPVDPARPVTMPGERGLRARDQAGSTVDVEDATWRDIVDLATQFGVALPAVPP